MSARDHHPQDARVAAAHQDGHEFLCRRIRGVDFLENEGRQLLASALDALGVLDEEGDDALAHAPNQRGREVPGPLPIRPVRGERPRRWADDLGELRDLVEQLEAMLLDQLWPALDGRAQHVRQDCVDAGAGTAQPLMAAGDEGRPDISLYPYLAVGPAGAEQPDVASHD